MPLRFVHRKGFHHRANGTDLSRDLAIESGRGGVSPSDLALEKTWGLTDTKGQTPGSGKSWSFFWLLSLQLNHFLDSPLKSQWKVLTLKKLGIDDLVHFDFLDPPAPETMM